MTLPDEAIRLRDIAQELFSNCQEKETRHAEKFHVSVVEFRCLKFLLHHSELNVNQLAEKLKVTCSRITRIVDGLVQKGLVHRTTAVNDRRVNLITLTKKGNISAVKISESYDELHLKILNGIPKDKQELMIEMLHVMNNSVINVLREM